jgi:hypothetical protein
MTKDNEFYGLDDRGLAETSYSPVCNLCKHFSIVSSIESDILYVTLSQKVLQIRYGDEITNTQNLPEDHGTQFEQSYSAE